MLRIPLRPSGLLAATLIAAHAASAWCAVTFVPGLPWNWMVAGLVLLSLGWHVRRDALLLAGDSPIELTVHADGRLELRLRDGSELEGRVTASTFVSPLLIVIAARMETDRRRGIVVLPDSASAEDRRSLRVRLRHGIKTAAALTGKVRTGSPDSTRL